MRDSNKSTKLFKQVIEQKLTEMGQQDELFARTLMKADKNIDDCVTYILSQIQQSGICGFTDDEVFEMAAHYYDQDDIEVGTSKKCNIVMNHTVQLSDEEKEEAKKKAKAEIRNYERQKLTNQAKEKFKTDLILEHRENLTEHDIAEAKKDAKQQVIDEETERLTRKKTVPMIAKRNTEVVSQNSLF